MAVPCLSGFPIHRDSRYRFSFPFNRDNRREEVGYFLLTPTSFADYAGGDLREARAACPYKTTSVLAPDKWIEKDIAIRRIPNYGDTLF